MFIERSTLSLSHQSSNSESVNRTISWRDSSGATHCERVTGSEDSHQPNFTDTGPVEIAITFSDDVCSKTTVTSYSSERVCGSVGTMIILLLFIQAQSVQILNQLHQLPVQVRPLSDIGGCAVRW